MVSEESKKKVLEALEDDRFKWRTTKGIASEVGIPEEEVLEAISISEDDVVKSSIPSEDGSPLFTTKRHFRKKSSSLDRILGAFKGRIR